MTNNDWLDVAASIGARLSTQAQWSEDRCTWDVMVPDSVTEGEGAVPSPEQATGELYQGTAGMALFLGELYRLTGDRDVRRTAVGAIRHAFASWQAEPRLHGRFGLFAGLTGIAYAAARVGSLVGEDAFLEQAQDAVASLVGDEHRDGGLDLVGGAAGAIPALLAMRHTLDRETCEGVAIRLGEHLIQTAAREPRGWAWGSANNSTARHLTGLAHGTAGYAIALLELYRATGQGRFRFAAEMAFLYEQSMFDAERGNWPDLRHHGIGDLLFYDRLDELEAKTRSGEIGAYRRAFMTAWCHGAPGVALARLRAFELTGEESYRREAETAIEGTRKTLDRLWNYSLCHGVAGNAEVLLYASEVFDQPDLRTACEEYAAYGRETYELTDTPWHCGTQQGARDPSLMLGESGIGLFYLRLADPETPPIVLLRPAHDTPASTAEPEKGDGGAIELAREEVDRYFGGTLHAFDALGSPIDRLGRARDGGRPERSPSAAAYQGIGNRLDQAEGTQRALLEDASQRDRARFETALDYQDYTHEYLRWLVRPSADEVDWPKARLALPAGCSLVATDHDWDAWLATEPASRPERPPEDPVYTVVFREKQAVQTRPVSGFAALVLSALDRPSDLAALSRSVAAALGDDVEPARVRPKVEAQARQLYQAGWIDLADARPRAEQPADAASSSATTAA